jgi:hypothetical protein
MNPTLQTKARIAGVFNLLTLLGGGLALVFGKSILVPDAREPLESRAAS